MQTAKCPQCNKPYSPDCDWQQGRCPGHPPLIDVAEIQQKIRSLVRKMLKK